VVMNILLRSDDYADATLSFHNSGKNGDHIIISSESVGA
jgi:hypothetical protein